MFTTHHSANTPSFVAGQFGLQAIANDAHSSLRQQAVANDETSSEELPLARLWLELASGSCKAVDGFFCKTRCYLVTTSLETPLTRPLKRRTLAILELVLRGSAQKAVSLDLNLAASTITANARRALAWMGLACKPSCVHPLLILAASAAGEHDQSVTGAVSVMIREGVVFRIVSVARPEARAFSELPPAELDIVRCLMEGISHAGMARLRGTSQRTIANQIGSVFRRLGVACRMELIHRLFASSRISASTRPVSQLGVRSHGSRAQGAVG